MYLIVIHLSFLEIAVLFCGAVILGLAIYFFIDSQRSLKEALEETKKKSLARPGSYQKPVPPPPKKEIDVIAEPAPEHRYKRYMQEEVKTVTKSKPATREEVENLKETILQQQKLLNGFLRQVEEIQSEGKEELEMQNKHLEDEIKLLESQLQKRTANWWR